jgi:hypothetical protein
MEEKELWSDGKTVRTLLVLFAGLAITALAAGASRMSQTGWQMGICGDILTWRVALSMFLFAPAIGVMFWLIARAVGRGNPSPACCVLTVLTVYFVACGMGMHDPMNAMQAAYSASSAVPAPMKRTLDFFDDRLGHWVFWAGFVLGSWVLGIQQVVTPLDRKLSWKAVCAILVASAAMLWVMLTNLWDEYPKTKQDLCVIAWAAVLPTGAWIGSSVPMRRLPMLVLLLPAYWGSIVGTIACWVKRYGW